MRYLSMRKKERKKCPRTDSWGIPTLKDVEYKEEPEKSADKKQSRR